MRIDRANTTTHLEWILNKSGAKAPFLFVIDRIETTTKIKINRFDYPFKILTRIHFFTLK